MSERLKRSVGAICICCNIHEKRAKSLGDPDWLETVGHPTIPHVQSLREPPANVALHSQSGHLIGLTTRNATKRYLEKLRKERERNQEVLAECVDKLPIVIKPVAYLDKPYKHFSRRSFPGSASRRHHGDHCQENIDRWIKEEDLLDNKEAMASKLRPGQSQNINGTNRSHKRGDAQQLPESDTAETNGFVHHPGFQGIPERQANNLRYKFGKKKPKPGAGHDETKQPVLFNPRGYGSLYDELEFDRRYKKVFDVNKHIHFVNSNFLNGQRIFKRNKLPPIGHISSTEYSEGHDDIFAIMSVQRFNHPKDEKETTSGPDNVPNNTSRTASTPKSSSRKSVEITQELEVPMGFIPGTIKPTGSSPFHGVKGQLSKVVTKETKYRLSLKSRESDSALGTLTDDSHQTTQDTNDLPSGKPDDIMKTQRTRDNKFKPNLGNTPRKNKEVSDKELAQDTDYEQPFNISVHVAIKPKQMCGNGGDDIESERVRERNKPIIEESECSDDDVISVKKFVLEKEVDVPS